jgi:hypothetical protein
LGSSKELLRESGEKLVGLGEEGADQIIRNSFVRSRV